MKNPFKKLWAGRRSDESANDEAVSDQPAVIAQEPQEPEGDGFEEWCRTQVHGGIERRERNDIFEAYSVYGADSDGRLTMRYYHRYPEHERDFDLSYSRSLGFEDFNRRLLSELDGGNIKLEEYQSCIRKAEQYGGSAVQPDGGGYFGFTEDEISALQDFCESIDILQNKSYLHSGGVFSCESESVVGGERLIIRFRKPLSHDAVGSDITGVLKETVYSYDVDNMWIMGVFNRVSAHCESYSALRLTSQWSIEKESVYLISAESFPSVDGTLMIAVGEADSFRRFGFYSLDFSKK